MNRSLRSTPLLGQLSAHRLTLWQSGAQALATLFSDGLYLHVVRDQGWRKPVSLGDNVRRGFPGKGTDLQILPFCLFAELRVGVHPHERVAQYLDTVSRHIRRGDKRKCQLEGNLEKVEQAFGIVGCAKLVDARHIGELGVTPGTSVSELHNAVDVAARLEPFRLLRAQGRYAEDHGVKLPRLDAELSARAAFVAHDDLDV